MSSKRKLEPEFDKCIDSSLKSAKKQKKDNTTLDIYEIDLPKLIKIGTEYKNDKTKKYVSDLQIISRLLPSLTKLNNMIGLNKLKKQIVEWILYFAQYLDDEEGELMNIIIDGEPGTGKTTIANIISEILSKLQILPTNNVISAKRSDFIGAYLGQTAIKTTELLEKARGGILFIDEAYSLGNPEGRDSYSKEAIDTLNAFLLENKRDLVVILAGYKEAINKCFLAVNQGLERRFPWRMSIDTYSSENLQQIFIKQIGDSRWEFKDNDPEKVIPKNFFNENKIYFKHNGGDTYNFFLKCKIAHGYRVFTKPRNIKKVLNTEDIENGFKLYTQSENISSRKEDKSFLEHLYV